MTPVEIAYFKHFMLDKALIKTFCKYFRIYHIEENPKSIEEYFRNIPAEKVIVNAFFFKMAWNYWFALSDNLPVLQNIPCEI